MAAVATMDRAGSWFQSTTIVCLTKHQVCHDLSAFCCCFTNNCSCLRVHHHLLHNFVKGVKFDHCLLTWHICVICLLSAVVYCWIRRKRKLSTTWCFAGVFGLHKLGCLGWSFGYCKVWNDHVYLVPLDRGSMMAGKWTWKWYCFLLWFACLVVQYTVGLKEKGNQGINK
jgi:hypothetical protein